MKFVPYMLVGILWFGATAALADDSDDDNLPQTIRLTLHPAPEPKPALKYMLLPPITERVPGNAALEYPKSRLEMGSLAMKTIEEVREKAGDWLDLAADKLPLDEIRAALPKVARQIEWSDTGARRDRYDSEYPIHNGLSFSTLLPQLELVRDNARFVALKARLQIADGKYAEAIHSLQTGFAMAHHVAQDPLLVNALVGMAICGITCTPLEDLIGRPDSPNMYWAISALPRPFINLYPAMEFEHSCLYVAFPSLKDLGSTRRTPEQMNLILDQLADELSAIGTARPNREWFTVVCIKAYPAAKRYLIEHGYSPEQVEAMAVAQVVLLQALLNYDELRDDLFRYYFMPYAESSKLSREAERRFASGGDTREIVPLAQTLLPALRMVHLAAARNDRRLAALRIVEAVRLYAAEHQGRLPKKLTDVTAVPIPLDPVSGNAFEYSVVGDTATLFGPAPPDEGPNHGLKYELKMAK